MVACSPEGMLAEAVAAVEGRTAPVSNDAGVEAGGAGRAGSGVEGELGPAWFGFHMIRLIPFLISRASRDRAAPALVVAGVSRDF